MSVTVFNPRIDDDAVAEGKVIEPEVSAAKAAATGVSATS